MITDVVSLLGQNGGTITFWDVHSTKSLWPRQETEAKMRSRRATWRILASFAYQAVPKARWN